MADVSILGEVVPAYTSALATVGALGAAVWAGVVATRLHRVERKRDEAREEEMKTLQASRVAVWPDVQIARAELSPGRFYRTEHWGIKVANRSDLPIYRLEIEMTLTDGRSDVVRIGVLPPTDEPVARVSSELVIGPLDEPEDWEGIDDPSEVALTMQFWDSNGRGWERQRDGTLIGGADASIEYNRWWHSLNESSEPDPPRRRWGFRRQR